MGKWWGWPCIWRNLTKRACPSYDLPPFAPTFFVQWDRWRWMKDWLNDWWLTDWLMTDWLTDCLTDRQTDGWMDSPTDQLTEWMNEWMNESCNSRRFCLLLCCSERTKKELDVQWLPCCSSHQHGWMWWMWNVVWLVGGLQAIHVILFNIT